MKKMMLYLVPGFMVILSGCDKEEPIRLEPSDAFFFGWYGCECFGQCGKVYRISEDKLEVSNDSTCISEAHAFPGTTLSTQEFEIAKTLLEDFPDELFERDDETYGCPDCADQGGYFLRYKEGNTTRTWRIDTRDEDLPDFLKPYHDKLAQVRQDLN